MKRNLIIAGVLLAAIGIFLKLFVFKQGQQGKAIKDIYKFPPEICPGKTIDYSVPDVYMRGALEKGQKIKITLNWYSCNTVNKGDFVLYRYSLHEDPVIRRVVGSPGDQFKVVQSKDKKSWKLIVNGEEIKEISGQEFVFGTETPPPLALAEKQQSGKLGPEHALILAAFQPGEKDSSVYGLISTKDLVGKVELPGSSEPQPTGQ